MKHLKRARVKKPPLCEPNLKVILAELHTKGIKKWLLEQLTIAFESARKGKLGTFDENGFELNWMANIVKLRDAILSREYEPGGSVSFVIFEPKVREIFAATFRDRVVHHFLYNMQAGWWESRFIQDSYSCRVGKGTLYGVERVQRMMWRASNNMTEKAWVAKFDIQGYFMSLPRKKVYAKVQWGLERQFASVMSDPLGRQLYGICDFLWGMVLCDDHVSKAWKRGPVANWAPEVLPPEKSLWTRDDGYGIVIGNLTSQLASNIYLNDLDRFVKYTLGYKNYGRYVDDFVIMVPHSEKRKLLNDVEKIEEFMENELELTLHPTKRFFQQVTKGVGFLGARVYPHCLYPSDRIQKNFSRAVKLLKNGRENQSSVKSYLGLMLHLDADEFIKRFDADYFEYLV